MWAVWDSNHFPKPSRVNWVQDRQRRIRVPRLKEIRRLHRRISILDGSSQGTNLPKSIAQIPVPVAMSRTRWGDGPMGA
jgi:hypothetical protein